MTLVFIISAPSGSGKSTLVAAIKQLVDQLEFSVSYTTRPPRGSEEDGRDYYYTNRVVFERMIGKGEFLEYADVFGNYYGTAKKFLDDAIVRGHDLLLDIDVQGASQLQEKLSGQISIFILPPNKAELEKRLRRRSSAERMTDEAVIQRRLETATREIEKYEEYDYILVNDQLGDSIDALKAIILTERLRAAGREPVQADEKELVELAESRRLERVRPSLGPILESFRKKTDVIHRGCEVDLYSGFDSNYRYILVAARRARQLQSGATPLVATDSTKPCHIAALELMADKVKWETTPLTVVPKSDPESGAA